MAPSTYQAGPERGSACGVSLICGEVDLGVLDLASVTGSQRGWQLGQWTVVRWAMMDLWRVVWQRGHGRPERA